MTIGHIIFCAKNEYIDSQFLAGGCGSRQRQVTVGQWGRCSIYRHPSL